MLFGWPSDNAPAVAIKGESEDGVASDDDQFGSRTKGASWGKKQQRISNGHPHQVNGNDGESSPLLPSGMSGDGSLIGALGPVKMNPGGQNVEQGGVGNVEPSELDDAWPSISAQLSAVGEGEESHGCEYLQEDQLLHEMGCDIFGALSSSPMDSPMCNIRAGDSITQEAGHDDVEATDKEMKKRVRLLEEKIRSTQALKDKASAGGSLTPAQQNKVAQLERLEADLDQIRKSGSIPPKLGRISGARGRGLGDDGARRGRKRGRGAKGMPMQAMSRQSVHGSNGVFDQGFTGSWDSPRFAEGADKDEAMARELHDGAVGDGAQLSRSANVAMALPSNLMPQAQPNALPASNGASQSLLAAPAAYGAPFSEGSDDRLAQKVQQLAMKIRYQLAPMSDLAAPGGLIEGLRSAVVASAQHELHGASMSPAMRLRVQHNLRARLKDVDQLVSSLVQGSKDLSNAIYALSQPHVGLSALGGGGGGGGGGTQPMTIMSHMVGSNFINGSRPDLQPGGMQSCLPPHVQQPHAQLPHPQHPAHAQHLPQHHSHHPQHHPQLHPQLQLHPQHHHQHQAQPQHHPQPQPQLQPQPQHVHLPQLHHHPQHQQPQQQHHPQHLPQQQAHPQHPQKHPQHPQHPHHQQQQQQQPPHPHHQQQQQKQPPQHPHQQLPQHPQHHLAQQQQHPQHLLMQEVQVQSRASSGSNHSQSPYQPPAGLKVNDAWPPDKPSEPGSFSEDVSMQRRNCSGSEGAMPTSSGPTPCLGPPVACSSAPGYASPGMAAHQCMTPKSPMAQFAPHSQFHQQFQAQMMQQHLQHLQHLGHAPTQQPAHMAPVHVQPIVQPVGPPIQGGVPVQSLHQAQQQQALKQQHGAGGATQLQRAQPPPPNPIAPPNQPAALSPSANPSPQQPSGVPPRPQASLEHPSAREIVLCCTNCKLMLQLPTTNVDELRQVQCGACSQVMDITGPPSLQF